MRQSKSKQSPITYKIALWYSFIFSSVFVVYAAVSTILAILDRNYVNISQPIMFGLLGAVLISFSFGFKELRKWGWYGLIAINSMVIIYGLFDLQESLNIVLMIFSGGVIASLFTPSTKDWLGIPR